jgi:hypothetical protein
MAVWAIAWAGSKPLASITDGLLAGWIGVRPTGMLLALPAFLPIAVLAGLAWKSKRWHGRRTSAPAPAAPAPVAPAQAAQLLPAPLETALLIELAAMLSSSPERAASQQ